MEGGKAFRPSLSNLPLPNYTLPSLGPIVYRLPPVERRVYPSIRPNLLCSGCYLLCLLKDFSPVFLLHHNFSLYHFHAYTNTLSGFHFIPHPGLQPHGLCHSPFPLCSSLHFLLVLSTQGSWNSDPPVSVSPSSAVITGAL